MTQATRTLMYSASSLDAPSSLLRLLAFFALASSVISWPGRLHNALVCPDLHVSHVSNGHHVSEMDAGLVSMVLLKDGEEVSCFQPGQNYEGMHLCRAVIRGAGPVRMPVLLFSLVGLRLAEYLVTELHIALHWSKNEQEFIYFFFLSSFLAYSWIEKRVQADDGCVVDARPSERRLSTRRSSKEHEKEQRVRLQHDATHLSFVSERDDITHYSYNQA